jgi:putative DNA primase/helicase
MNDFNEWADFWRNRIGVNIIPADSRNKRPIVLWKEFQDKPIPGRLHNQWKNQSLFDNGIAIILGKVWHRNDRQDYYLNCIDVDNLRAIQEFFARNGKATTIEEFSKKTIIEQHRDNPNRLHLYVYTVGKPLRDKSSDVGRLSGNVDPDTIPAFEVKASSNLLSFCCPGIHKDGHKVEIIGIREPAVLEGGTIDDMQDHIDAICIKYDLIRGNNNSNNQIPISELFKDDTIIYEGHNRHAALLRVMESLLRRNAGLLSPDQIERLSKEWNVKHCQPPLDDGEFGKQWKCALDFIAKRSYNNSTSSPKQQEDEEDYIDGLIEEYHFKTIRDNGDIWYYDSKNGIFIPNAESIIKERLEADFRYSDNPITSYQKNECIIHIQHRTYINRDDLNHDIAWIACNNCMINLITGEIQPFDPKFLSTTRIPVNYDHGYPTGMYADFFRYVESHGNSGKIVKFLYDIMEPPDVDLFLDFLAYCLWREYKYNYWLMLHGAGFNGKSILLQLIERFLGKDNVSGETLDRLLRRDFSIANIYQKMVNLDADVSADLAFKNTGIIKKLTGNDLYTGEFKYKTPFKFRNYAKLIFSCNKLPENEDSTDAFFRRILIISFTQQFFGEKDDPHIIDKICTTEEFTDLLYELLPRLRRILQDGFRMVTNESLAESYDKYSRGADPVKYFFEKALELDPQNKIPKLELLEHYQNFCREEGLATESDQSLSRKLSQYYNLQQGRTKVKGQQFYYWKGVKKVDFKRREKEALEMLNDFENVEQALNLQKN